MKLSTLILITSIGLIPALTQADASADLLARYAAGGKSFSAERGRQLWQQEVNAKDGKPRSCQSCHTSDLTGPGKHASTGKPIEPMAPSVNPQRLSDARKIEKWFTRNCKWTWGRACTDQEKGDLLTFLGKQ